MGGTLVGNDTDIDGVCFDSRLIVTGQVFVALCAERDGHDFVAQVTGIAAAAIVQRAKRPANGWPLTVIEVDDTQQALLALGSYAREQLMQAQGRVVAITGSVGKTSTKDFIHAVFSSQFSLVVASEKSFNNDIGLPVTLLAAPRDAQAVVLEMGMRGFGEISRLCSVASPDIGVITRVGEAHTERVDGVMGVQKAKAELVQSLPKSGWAVLNADDELVLAMRPLTHASVLTYGANKKADVRFKVMATDDEGRIIAEVHHKVTGETAVFRCSAPGLHMASNAVAALAVAGLVGIELTQACRALETVNITGSRMERRSTASGAILIDDSYNANPTSTQAALMTLASLDVLRRVAVLGIMAEVADANEAHLRIALMAQQLGIELIAVETDLYGVVGLSCQDAIGRLAHVGDEAAILVKGSRVAQLERVVQALVG
ncbi:MAG: UDP-N-acetylmuramoyl-tripeptide--D-alanyl-D-alanine ligase [Ilumatobacteraceae bacterium]|nr:UDP-N-acetylmuramoyl-tripeptide--D-alanyl-D-alanine ligase [Ilumatobacteraceae bacterium]